MNRWRQLVAVKDERVRGSERSLQRARTDCEAAAAKVEQERRLADEAAEKGRDARQALFKPAAEPSTHLGLRDVIAHSYAAHYAALSCAEAVATAQKAHHERLEAVAQAEQALRQASRAREKALRQRARLASGERIARARRLDAELEEFIEARAHRRQAADQVA